MKVGSTILQRDYKTIKEEDPFGKQSSDDEISHLSDIPDEYEQEINEALALIEPDSWYNIPVCLVKAISTLTDCLFKTNLRVSKQQELASTGFLEFKRQFKSVNRFAIDQERTFTVKLEQTMKN